MLIYKPGLWFLPWLYIKPFLGSVSAHELPLSPQVCFSAPGAGNRFCSLIVLALVMKGNALVLEFMILIIGSTRSRV